MTNILHCDIFCHVIDNYGDVGVCWRLARALRAELGWTVRLICDDVAAFTQLCQRSDDVSWYDWSTPPSAPGQVVIEAFACELPEAYLHAMSQRPGTSVWINLEYLSAEPWVEDCHGLSSPHPRLPLVKYFYFPGFTRRTGGLLVESTIRSSLAGNTASARRKEPLSIFLFCYANPALASLVSAWKESLQPLHLIVPPGPAQDWLRSQVLPSHVSLDFTPFVDQRDFDDLLQRCDWLFVRGEDSFIRAQLAAKPFIWHIYPQNEVAHEKKLEAFHRRFTQSLDSVTADLWENFSWAWNRGESVQTLWHALSARRQTLNRHAQQWQHELLNETSLVKRLSAFVASKL